MNNVLQKIQIMFWKNWAKLFDLRPTKHLPKWIYYPIISTPIKKSGKYDYPQNIEILFEWNEKGRHWIVFSLKPILFCNIDKFQKEYDAQEK